MKMMMETLMEKRLLTHRPLPIFTSVANWFARSRWKDARKLRNIDRWSAPLAARLDAHILYDIGERDCRPQPCRSPIWHSNPYHLLIESLMNRDTAGFDRRA